MKKERGIRENRREIRWGLIGKILLCSCIFLVFFAFTALIIIRFIGGNELRKISKDKTPVLSAAGEEPQQEVWQEGGIRYQDEVYTYNEDIMTFLLMGVDTDEKVSPAPDSLSGGQTDALFLAVMNPHKKEITIIAVNRNTMAAVDVYDADGVYMGQYTKQITLQHGYGDGMELSCERTAAAVSRLFYQLPIHGYAAINMGAVSALNDAVGGVRVVVLDDVIYPEYDMDLHAGDEVTLTGHQAYWYVRGRYEYLFNSSSLRLERQKQFLTTFISQAKQLARKDIRAAVELYQIASDYMVTDIDLAKFTYLASEALGYRFDIDNLYTLQGKTIMGEDYEEFYVDEEALYQMIVDIFYEPAEK